MEEEGDENGQTLADAVTRVRVFVAQQLRAGQRADALSFALTFVATDLGLRLTHAGNPLGVVRTVLQGVITAASNAESNARDDSAAGAEGMPSQDLETGPAEAVIH